MIIKTVTNASINVSFNHHTSLRIQSAPEKTKQIDNKNKQNTHIKQARDSGNQARK
jgi:hypothetical protein